MFDLIIRNGTVYDGSSADATGYMADVGISDGVITAIGDLSQAKAEVCDAAGLVVAPGLWISTRIQIYRLDITRSRRVR